MEVGTYSHPIWGSDISIFGRRTWYIVEAIIINSLIWESIPYVGTYVII